MRGLDRAILVMHLLLNLKIQLFDNNFIKN